jgi:hypothetical protein
MIRSRVAVLGLVGVVLALPARRGVAAENVAADMAGKAASLLGKLTPEQRARATFAFDEEERVNWHFIPKDNRPGVTLKEMDEAQRGLAHELIDAGLSAYGTEKVAGVMALEGVLLELGGDPSVRDPEKYSFSIFGRPGAEPWGWRVEGHHLSLNFTVVGGALVASAPAFFGSNPAHVPSGSKQGFRLLGQEEDLGRKLIEMLDEAQRRVAIISTDAPDEIVTGVAAKVDPLTPVGIGISALTPVQSALLEELIDEYLARMADDLALARRAALEASDLDKVAFAWAGGLKPGDPHYYRVQGPTFLIEYDNTQNGANHAHSIWRDFDGDFGRDLLREHHAAAHHHLHADAAGQ